ncbi:MAG TPA: UPF0149 family protein [Nevskiaceae bacterium]|nr:UPF0149 family protein [Nevskiaceae bacterium]
MLQPSTYPEILQALRTLNLDHTPAAWHGLLCGALCVDGAAQVDALRLGQADHPVRATPAGQSVLDAVKHQADTQLDGGQGDFVLLLPSDEQPLAARAAALAEWCDGFTFALGSRHPLDLDACSPDVREIVHDFTELTRAALGDGDDLEEEEGAYAELVEYVRVGVQLVYVELRRAHSPPRHATRSGNTHTVH